MQDKIVKFLAYDGRVRVTCISSTSIVEEARKVHDLSPLATAAFGRLLTISAIIGNEMKSEKHKLTVQIKCDGPLKTMLVTANNSPRLKGYVASPQVDLPLNEFGKLDVGGAVGRGYLNVIKDIGLKEPYVGISPLVSGEIAEDFAEYFSKSEQKDTAVALGVLVDKNGVRSAGGYIISPLPDATSEDITNLEKAIFEAGSISKMLDNNLSLEEIAKKITGDNNIKVIEENITPEYRCDCSKSNMERALVILEKEDLKSLIEDGQAELQCHFCNRKYEFSKEELEKIWNMKQ